MSRILLVEDNPIDRRVVEAALKKRGFDVTMASDGAEALTAHRRNPFDLILMDCQMPNMDGFEATRRIRDLATAQPFILAVAAKALDDPRDECLAVGMDGYLAKPIDIPKLIEAVELALKSRAKL